MIVCNTGTVFTRSAIIMSFKTQNYLKKQPKSWRGINKNLIALTYLDIYE